MIKRLSEKLYSHDHSWNYETLWTLTRVPASWKVKIEIRRNAYDGQSYGKAMVWSPERLCWNNVAWTAGPSLKCLTLSYVQRVVTEQNKENLEADTRDLLFETCTVLRVDGARAEDWKKYVEAS